MSQEFEYLRRKTRCEILIGGDNISNDAITLGTRFSMFVYVRAHFRFAPWRKYDSSVDGEPQENWGWNSNSRDVVASSPSFSLPATIPPRRTCSQAILIAWDHYLFLPSIGDGTAILRGHPSRAKVQPFAAQSKGSTLISQLLWGSGARNRTHDLPFCSHNHSTGWAIYFRFFNHTFSLWLVTSAEREVKDSRHSGMYQSCLFWQDWARKVCRFSVLFGCLTKWEPN